MNKFYYKQVDVNLRSFSSLINKIANYLPEGGRFYFNLARSMRVGGENYLYRVGEWSDPFDTTVHSDFTMPTYDPQFSLTFDEICDLRAQDIKKIIYATDRPIIVQWSGGIDSTVIMASLIKNLNDSEKERIIVSLSSDSLLEYPYFYTHFVKDKFKIVDSENLLFNDYKEKYNAYCIMGDTGDCIFGAELGNKLYSKIKFFTDDWKFLYNNVISSDVEYTRYKDIIIKHFNTNLQNSITSMQQQKIVGENISKLLPGDGNFGELFYEKIVRNIKTSNVPIYSLHDFFWWTIFNGRYMFCALRGPNVFSTTQNKAELINNCLIQWFNTVEYQLWSMKNNNNGEKISAPIQGQYKTACKRYIYDLTKDDWYYHHKMKIVSSPNIIKRNWRKHFSDFDPILGVDINYDVIKVGSASVNNYVIDSLMKHKIDWC